MAGHPVLVFDIGGTNVRGAVCDPGSGRPIETAWRATPNYLDHPGWDAERLFAATLDEMAAVGHELAGGVPPAALGGGRAGAGGPRARRRCAAGGRGRGLARAGGAGRDGAALPDHPRALARPITAGG